MKEDWYSKTIHQSQKHSSSSAGSKRACNSRLKKWIHKSDRRKSFDEFQKETIEQEEGYILCRRCISRYCFW